MKTSSAPWVGAVIAFLTAAALAAAIVPAVLYEWTPFWQAVAIVVLGVLGTPFGRLVGLTVGTRLQVLQAQIAAAPPPPPGSSSG